MKKIIILGGGDLAIKTIEIINRDKLFKIIGYYNNRHSLRNIKFLGDSGWNDSALPFSPGVSGVRKPIFADSFFLGSKTEKIEQLKRIHEQILYRHQNYIGPSSYTAHAYDTLMILRGQKLFFP